MMEGGAFGGAKVGAAFDPIAFVQRPQVILRALSMLFAIVIFGCISSQGWFEDDGLKQVCMYNRNSGACNYGSGIAVIAFLACFGFLAGEFFFGRMSSVKTRKHYVLADLGFSGFWTFLFFVSFCFLTNAWSKTSEADVPVANAKNPVQAAIAFTFFSIFTWGGLAYLAFMRFKQGTGSEFATGYDQQEGAGGGAAYAGYPGAMDGAGTDQSGYQEPPFAAAPPQDPATGANSFQPPAY